MSNIINNIALIESFGDFKDEKGISKIDLMAIIEDSLKTLLRKDMTRTITLMLL